MSKISLLLFGLLRQDVTFVRMFPLDFSCSGKGEPLFGTGISLHFWHFAVFEFVNIIFSLSPRSGEKVCKSNDFYPNNQNITPLIFLLISIAVQYAYQYGAQNASCSDLKGCTILRIPRI